MDSLFVFVTGFAFAYGCGVGLACAVCAGGADRSLCDSLNARNHWRGHLQVALALFVIGVIGQFVASVA